MQYRARPEETEQKKTLVVVLQDPLPPALELFRLRLLVAKTAYGSGFLLTLAAAALAISTGDPYWLGGGLGSGGLWVVGHLNLKAAQAIACPENPPVHPRT